MIDWTLIVLFAVVGAVVSLDVFGLTLSQGRLLAKGRPGVLGWAFWNALWHSVLLLVYTLVIAEVFRLRLGILEWLGSVVTLLVEAVVPLLRPTLLGALVNLDVDMSEYIEVIIREIQQHATIVLGIVTLVIVWQTYADKISSRPENADTENLPFMAQTVHGLLTLTALALSALGRKKFMPRRFREAMETRDVRGFLTLQAMCALVAVDMLALAALMNAMGHMRTRGNQAWLVAIVFVTVFVLALWAGRLSVRFARLATPTPEGEEPRVSPETRNWIAVTIRVLEPTMIFYFLLQLVAYLIFETRVHSMGLVAGALILLVALVRKNTLDVVVASSLSGFEESRDDSVADERADREPRRDVERPAAHDPQPQKLSLKRPSSLREARDEFLNATRFLWAALPKRGRRYVVQVGKVLAWTVGGSVLVFLSLLATLRISYGEPSSFSPEAALSWILFAYGLLAGLLTMLIGAPFLERYDPVKNLLKSMLTSTGTSVCFLLALALASVLPVLEQFIDEAWKISYIIAGRMQLSDLAVVGMRENHVHAIQIALWILLLIVMSLGYQAFRRSQGAGARMLKGRFVGFVIAVSSVLLLGIGHAQEWLRVKVLPHVVYGAGTNGTLFPSHPALAQVELGALKRREVVVYLGFVDEGHGYGANVVVNTLIGAGADMRVTRARSAEEFRKDLQSADVLVVPEQLGFYERKEGDALWNEYVAAVESMQALVKDRMSEGLQLVVTEGDTFAGPGVHLAEKWGGLDLQDVRQLSAEADLEKASIRSSLTRNVVPTRAHCGITFRETRKADAWIYHDERNGSGEHERRVLAARKGRCLFIGLDFHKVEKWQQQLLINACRGESLEQESASLPR